MEAAATAEPPRLQRCGERALKTLAKKTQAQRPTGANASEAESGNL